MGKPNLNKSSGDWHPGWGVVPRYTLYTVMGCGRVNLREVGDVGLTYIYIWGFPKMVVPNNHGFSY